MGENVTEKLNKFFGTYRLYKYKKGEIIVRADDDIKNIFYIKEGYVKKYAISKKGDEVVINVFKPGSFFPMSRAITGFANKYFYEAKNSVEVWRAPSDDALKFIKNNPDVLYELLTRIYRGLDGFLMRIVYLMSGTAYTRLVTEIIIFARRFGVKDEKTGNVICKVSEKDLAAQSGITRETVSREMKRLKDKRLVEFHTNTLVIKSMKLLEDELKDDFNGLDSE